MTQSSNDAQDGLEGLGDLRSLYEEHAAFLRNMLGRLGVKQWELDDQLQEVFLIAWRRRADYDARRPVRPWLVGIAVRIAAGTRRKARLWRFLGLSAVDELADPSTPATVLDQHEAKRLVRALLERLSEKKRTVFVLYELQGMSGEEIAAAVGCPLKTVWTRLFHARKEFAALLGGGAGGEVGFESTGRTEA